jgi:hypothetical protein
MDVMRDKDNELQPVPGYKGKYLVTRDGRVFRRTATNDLKRVADSNGRVRLYLNGSVERPNTETVVERAFG